MFGRASKIVESLRFCDECGKVCDELDRADARREQAIVNALMLGGR